MIKDARKAIFSAFSFVYCLGKVSTNIRIKNDIATIPTINATGRFSIMDIKKKSESAVKQMLVIV